MMHAESIPGRLAEEVLRKLRLVRTLGCQSFVPTVVMRLLVLFLAGN